MRTDRHQRDKPATPDHPLSVRGFALEVLQQVVQQGRSLTEAIGPFRGRLGERRDAALLQELCYGTLRWYGWLQVLVAKFMHRPLRGRDQDIQLLILLGIYQLLYTRIPPHAAISTSVELARALGKDWATGLVNGILRHCVRQLDEIRVTLETATPCRHAMPGWLLQRLQTAYPDQWPAILGASQERPPLALRVNLRRLSRDNYLARLKTSGIEAVPIAHTASGLVLKSPMEAEEIPGFVGGEVSVQDGGAQLASALLDVQAGQLVLDACAAPGGKTGHILETAPPGVILSAVDNDPSRLQRVKDNLGRLGLTATLFLGDITDPGGAWAEKRYDRILLDVPCSATGVIRRHPDIKVLRRPEDILSLSDQQRRMLEAVWPLLTPGGRLLYLSCSLLPEENELQMAALLQRHPEAHEIKIRADWGQARRLGRQILPGEAGMDGFYFACVEKT